MREALREGARWRTSALGRVKQGAVLTGTGMAMRGACTSIIPPQAWMMSPPKTSKTASKCSLRRGAVYVTQGEAWALGAATPRGPWCKASDKIVQPSSPPCTVIAPLLQTEITSSPSSSPCTAIGALLQTRSHHHLRLRLTSPSLGHHCKHISYHHPSFASHSIITTIVADIDRKHIAKVTIDPKDQLHPCTINTTRDRDLRISDKDHCYHKSHQLGL
ncbi:hypothetical protein CK203_042347 [Vitis vinifera]|uniref:Uncharacterized protein n=1 Tax=Vitis vinifera TaxID=29760 RepID=A0A438H600_VITVI|nr:hypothetical protein CK203_042347 [Vitis vinifera]